LGVSRLPGKRSGGDVTGIGDEHSFLAQLMQLYGVKEAWEDGERTWWEARQRQLGREPKEMPPIADFRPGRNVLLRELLGPLLAVLPRKDRRVIKQMPIAFAEIRSFNAQVIRAPNGKPLLLMNSGLPAVVSFYWEMLSSRARIHDGSGPLKATDYLSEMYCFVLNYFATGGQVAFPRVFIPMNEDEYRWLVIRRSIQVEMFILAHEIIHVLSGHYLTAPTRAVAADAGNPGRTADFYQMSQEQEFDADWEGLRLYQSAWPHSRWSGGQMDVFDYISPLYIFVLQALVERNIPANSLYSTHPSAQDRIAGLLGPIFTRELTRPEEVELRSQARILLQLVDSVPYMTEFLVPKGDRWDPAQGRSTVVVGISVSPAVVGDDRTELIEAFNEEFRVTEYGPAFSGDWATLIAVAQDVGAVIGAVNGIIALSDKINKWRRKMRAEDKEAAVRLQNEGAVLDLATATDEEVEQWLRQLNQRGHRLQERDARSVPTPEDDQT
jgi:hypothetical protein